MTCSTCNSEYDMFGNAYSASFVPGTIVGRGVDGFPIHAAAGANPANILATGAFVASGLALGWLLTGSVIEFFKK